jgi:phage-related minor tail protein
MDEDDLISPARLSDMRALNALTQNLSKTSESFGKSITNAFAKGIVEGKRFEDVLRNVGKAMTTSLLKTALNPLTTGISSLLSSGVKSLTGLFSGSLGLGGLGGGAAARRSCPLPMAVSSPRPPISRLGAASA